jgi:hypothetical protein
MKQSSKLLLGLLVGIYSTSQVLGELTLSPAPVVEGLSDSKVELNVKQLDLEDEGRAFEDYLSKGYEETKVYLLELSSPTPYWLDYMSSMGANSREELMKWVENTLLSKYKEKEKLSSVVEVDSMLSSFFNGATKSNLKEGIEVTSNFVGKLLSPYEDRAAIDRRYYAMSSKICPFSQRLFSVIIIDPEPFQGPDKKTYLVIIESIYEE